MIEPRKNVASASLSARRGEEGVKKYSEGTIGVFQFPSLSVSRPLVGRKLAVLEKFHSQSISTDHR